MGRLKKRIIKLIISTREDMVKIFDKIINMSKTDTIDYKFDRESTVRDNKLFTAKYPTNNRPNGT